LAVLLVVVPAIGEKLKKIHQIALGDSFLKLRRQYNQMTYLGRSVEADLAGHQWNCTDGIDVIIRTETVIAITVRSTRISVYGVKVGDSREQVERMLGEIHEMRVRVCSLGDNSLQKLELNYPEKNVRIVMIGGRVARVVVCDIGQ
jgi:hypothetical protein